MQYAEIHLTEPDWNGPLPFLILRAAHYAEVFHGIGKMYLDCAEPPQTVLETWKASLEMYRRKIVIHSDPGRKINGRAFCAPDFIIHTDSGDLTLGIPEIPGLTDFHVHTKLAYCSENMNVAMALKLEHLSGVKHVHFSEHSGQLFSQEPTYWSNEFYWRKRQACDNRTAEYEKLIVGSPAALFGLELDVDADCEISDFQSPLLNGYRLGAVHFLGKDLSYEEKKIDFMRRLDALLAHGIDILAHPFRVFRRSALPIPEDLFEAVADRLAAANVAAELNFHTNHPPEAFVEMVLKKGGKLSFGTDSHNLYEAGYLRPHYEYCKNLGIAGRLDDILLKADKTI